MPKIWVDEILQSLWPNALCGLKHVLGEVIEEDAADIAARKKRLIAEREAAELKKRSQVNFLLDYSSFVV